MRGLQRTLMTAASTASQQTTSIIWTGLLFKRAPIVTRTLSPLEHAYLADKAFQQTLDATPFASEFYFKKGTPAEQSWAAAQDKSIPIAKQVIEPVESLPRSTEADALNDLTSLNRALERTLFLIVKDPSSKEWRLPRGAMKEDEVLHTAADRLVGETFGGQMDVWRVGQAPVGHVVSSKDKVRLGFSCFTQCRSNVDALEHRPFL